MLNFLVFCENKVKVKIRLIPEFSPSFGNTADGRKSRRRRNLLRALKNNIETSPLFASLLRRFEVSRFVEISKFRQLLYMRRERHVRSIVSKQSSKEEPKLRKANLIKTSIYTFPI